jgi:hypothetical protein
MLFGNVVRSLKALVLVTVMLNLGCGDQQAPPPTGLDLEVTVTQKGKPLAGAELNFVPVDGTPRDAIYAQADGQGKATIVSAQPVEYKVSISRMAAGGADPAFEKYGEATPLRANAGEKTSFTFDLE